MQEIAQTFGVDWPHLTAQVISFSIVCVLLYRFAYAPVLAMLATRRAQIAQGIANTEKINAALAAIDAQREGILSEARVEATRLISEGRAAAERIRERETAAARRAAERILLEARDQSVRERDAMRVEARREIGHLVVQTAAAVTGRVLTADDQQRLVRETSQQLKAA